MTDTVDDVVAAAEEPTAPGSIEAISSSSRSIRWPGKQQKGELVGPVFVESADETGAGDGT